MRLDSHIWTCSILEFHHASCFVMSIHRYVVFSISSYVLLMRRTV